MRNAGWKAGGTARDEAREAGLESRGGRTFLQHWLWQCSGVVGFSAGSFMVCVGSEVCWKSPLVCIANLLLQLEAARLLSKPKCIAACKWMGSLCEGTI